MALLKASFLHDLKPLKEIIENIEEYTKLDSEAENNPPSPPFSKGGLGGFEKSLSEETRSIEQRLPDKETETTSIDEPPVQELERRHSYEKTLTDEIWENAAKKMGPPLASKLSKSSFKLTGDKLILTLNGGYSVFADSIRKNSEFIEQVFSEELGGKVSLEIEVVKKKTIRKKDLKEEMMADPAIKEVLELFDGRIVDVMPITEAKE
jgi:hypothetical protein